MSLVMRERSAASDTGSTPTQDAASNDLLSLASLSTDNADKSGASPAWQNS